MIITNKNTVLYKIEMTAVQVNDIQEFLIAARKNDSALTVCGELYGPTRTDEILETLSELLFTFENRLQTQRFKDS